MNGFGTSPLELMAADAQLRGEINCQQFVYPINYTGANVLGADATVDVQLQINSDSDFIVQEISLVSNTADDTPEVDPDYLWNPIIAGSGRQIFGRAVHVQNVCGNFRVNVAGPARLPYPWLLIANTTLTSTLTDQGGTASTFCQIALSGFKVWYTGGNRRTIFHVA